MATGPVGRGQSGSKRVNLRFRLPYYTQWGQNLKVLGSDTLLGSWNAKHGLAMAPHHEDDDLIWSAQLTVPETFGTRYNYCLVDENQNVIKWESGSHRNLLLPVGLPNGATVDIYDFWQDGCAPESLLARSAFREVIFRNSNRKNAPNGVDSKKYEFQYPPGPLNVQDEIIVCFKINCVNLENGETVNVVGSSSGLGNWENAAALNLSNTGNSSWQGQCVIKRHDFPIKYSYILNNKHGEVIFELGEGRQVACDSFLRKPSAMMVVSDGYFKRDPWRGAGFAIPVFSIRSSNDVGVGEFLDIKPLVDLAVKSGLCLLQLLPVNDTSVHGMWWDSYPYSSLSVFALHPLYLRLQAMSQDIPHDIKEEIRQARKQLDLKDVDYEATMAIKICLAKKLFYLEKDKVFQTPEFKEYFEENKEWLKPYAAFCFLRDLFGTADHSQWGLFSSYSPEKLEKIVSPCSVYYNGIAFVYYLQFHLHSQLSEAAEYAKKNGVVLKGDLPIGVDRNSVDTWVFPTLFRMNTSTGAPPDYFDKNGQNWGFPTYNWEEMSKDNYAWWRARLSQMAKYFTAYRIDHILGFFRIWELPEHAVTGLMGRFRPSIPLSQEELEGQGIWDFNRLSEPYVRCHLLQEKFGSSWSEVANKYFDEYQRLCYKFKSEYSTEKKLLAGLKSSQGSSNLDMDKLRKGLFDILHELVLMRDVEDPRKFYPRFGMDDTCSFKELDDHSKTVLQRLYYDYFYHRQELLWRENALKTLPVLMSSSDMLTCGEDLGMVPACVPPVLKELGLLGLRIQRMASTPGQEFGIPSEYDYMTVCAPSCHDCSTMRAWWEEDENRHVRFFKDALGLGEVPPAKCTPDVAHMIIQQHMESPSMWAIFPLQDLLALKEEYADRPAKEETINDPTNPKHYWRFRTHVRVESLLDDGEFMSGIKDIVISSGRAHSPAPHENGYSARKDFEKLTLSSSMERDRQS